MDTSTQIWVVYSHNRNISRNQLSNHSILTNYEGEKATDINDLQKLYIVVSELKGFYFTSRLSLIAIELNIKSLHFYRIS